MKKNPGTDGPPMHPCWGFSIGRNKMKVDGDWGCGDGCGVSDTRKWTANSIYKVKCPDCGDTVEFFKDEKKRTCSNGHKVHNTNVGYDCC